MGQLAGMCVLAEFLQFADRLESTGKCMRKVMQINQVRIQKFRIFERFLWLQLVESFFL